MIRLSTLARSYNLTPFTDLPFMDMKALFITHRVLLRLPTVYASGFRGRSAKVYLVPWIPLSLMTLVLDFRQHQHDHGPSGSAHNKAAAMAAALVFRARFAAKAAAYRRRHPLFCALQALCQ